jgi:hypothetical protein
MIGKGEATDKWTAVNGLAIYSDLIFMPTTSSLWLAILATAHGVDMRPSKRLQHLRALFYNTNTAKLVKDYVKSCVMC